MAIGFSYYGEAWRLPPELADRAKILADEELNAFLDDMLPHHGQRQWTHNGHNLITDQGARWLCSRFNLSAVNANWYIMFKAAGTVLASDTAQSHPNWVEIQAAYTQPSRQQLILSNPTTGRSADNAANLASVTIGAASITIHGFGLISDPTKNGSLGFLLGAGDYLTPRSLVQNDIYRAHASVTF